jgi:hypothetical protein
MLKFESNDKENKEYFKLIDPIDDLQSSTTQDESIIESISEISRTSCMVSSVKNLTKQNAYFKWIIYAIFCNPFIKLLIHIFYKMNIFKFEDFDIGYNPNIEDLLSEKEKTTLTMFVLGLLSLFNILIVFLVRDFGFKLLLLTVNNMYLLLFAYTKYQEEKNNTREKESYHSLGWDSFQI